MKKKERKKGKERNYFFPRPQLSEPINLFKLYRNTHDVGFGLFRCLWGS